MSDQNDPTPIRTGFASEKENEITHLADFMLERTTNDFEVAVACEIGAIGIDHHRIESECSAFHGGYDEFMPCDEWQRAINLGIAWLKARVVQVEPDQSARASAPKRIGG